MRLTRAWPLLSKSTSDWPVTLFQDGPVIEGTGQPDQGGGLRVAGQFGQSVEDGVKGAAFTAPERVGDGQPNAMLGGHVPSGRRPHDLRQFRLSIGGVRPPGIIVKPTFPK